VKDQRLLENKENKKKKTNNEIVEFFGKAKMLKNKQNHMEKSNTV